MVRKKVPWRLTYRNHINTLLCQILRSWLLDITGDAANPEFLGEFGIREDMSDNRTTLVARCAEDSDQLGHIERFPFVVFVLRAVENVFVVLVIWKIEPSVFML